MFLRYEQAEDILSAPGLPSCWSFFLSDVEYFALFGRVLFGLMVFEVWSYAGNNCAIGIGDTKVSLKISNFSVEPSCQVHARWKARMQRWRKRGSQRPHSGLSKTWVSSANGFVILEETPWLVQALTIQTLQLWVRALWGKSWSESKGRAQGLSFVRVFEVYSYAFEHGPQWGGFHLDLAKFWLWKRQSPISRRARSSKRSRRQRRLKEHDIHTGFCVSNIFTYL